jgi:hypothetical protein
LKNKTKIIIIKMDIRQCIMCKVTSDNFSVKGNGVIYKTCKDCIEKNKMYRAHLKQLKEAKINILN